MNLTPAPGCLIAEDEPLLAAALQAELKLAWPELQVLALVGDGNAAVQQALALQPDVLFLDIRMPGLSGLEAAAELADAWPSPAAAGKPFPVLVFVTAYDQYAVQAFEAQAMDYLLKPVQAARLQKTVSNVLKVLEQRAQQTTDFEASMKQLRSLIAATPGPASSPLTMIQAGVGNSIRLIPVNDVLYFEAADKYVRVLTADHEYLIRTPLKELLQQLDARVFCQIHRATVVNTHYLEVVTRDEQGRLSVGLRYRPEKLPVSRLYAGQFKAM